MLGSKRGERWKRTSWPMASRVASTAFRRASPVVSTQPGVIVSTNAPPIGGYWHKLMTDPPENWDIFMQPPALLDDDTMNPNAENLENLAPDYYDNIVQGKSEEWINVYLKNKFGQGDSGKPVFRQSFKKSFHAKKGLRPVLQSSPARHRLGQWSHRSGAVFLQQDPRGRISMASAKRSCRTA